MKKFLIRDMAKIAIVLNVVFLFGIVFVTSARASGGSVAFSWLPNSGSNVIGYKIYYGTTSGGAYPNSVNINNNIPDPKDGRIHGTVTGLTNGVTYYFVCTAYNNSGESPYTKEVAYTVKTIAPKIKLIQIK
ncbi:MAG TPA: fibronectin type III domain-containing protein [Gammaproteobacteria bacterium]|nr:fibronectin type III domain-containing protein [Gammaproteobacteria bacterium]